MRNRFGQSSTITRCLGLGLLLLVAANVAVCLICNSDCCGDRPCGDQPCCHCACAMTGLPTSVAVPQPELGPIGQIVSDPVHESSPELMFDLYRPPRAIPV
ncbi:MAG: hypothetical protein HY304_06735 [candidate division Zixibacteria bacterium]|nr:hypothetical protein [candidate division Zixibacteria bacterium]